MKTFKILGIDHLGFVPKEPEVCKKFFSEILAIDFKGHEEVEDQLVDVSIFEISEDNSSTGPRVEILEPTSSQSPITNFLSKKGGGIHHIALRVDDIYSALDFMKKKNLKLIDDVPRLGANGKLIAFLHPQSCGGILVELVQ